MTSINSTVRRKRDIVTAAAVLLFILLIGFELFLVLILPAKLRESNTWNRQTIAQETRQTEDNLRAWLQDFDTMNDDEKGCVKLMRAGLDQLAGYLRRNDQGMSIDQIIKVHRVLLGFEEVYYAKLKKRRFEIEDAKINPDVIINSVVMKQVEKAGNDE